MDIQIEQSVKNLRPLGYRRRPSHEAHSHEKKNNICNIYQYTCTILAVSVSQLIGSFSLTVQILLFARPQARSCGGGGGGGRLGAGGDPLYSMPFIMKQGEKFIVTARLWRRIVTIDASCCSAKLLKGLPGVIVRLHVIGFGSMMRRGRCGSFLPFIQCLTSSHRAH